MLFRSRRTSRSAGAAARRSGDHRRRPPQLPSLPAAPLPGGHGGAQSERHRRADPLDSAAAEERLRDARRGPARRHQAAPGRGRRRRRRVLLAFEEAERETDPERQRAWLTFVIVGAGPTGAELAGALSEIARQTMLRDFRRINPSSARVILVEGKERVLPTYPADLSAKAEAQLERLGVEVVTDAVVTSLNDREVCIGEKTIPSRTVLWAAGVQASPLAASLDVQLDRAGRVIVNPDLTIPGHAEVFVIGDLAAVPNVPGVAPAAIQEGLHAARNIERALEGQPLRAFHYRDKGSPATRRRAAAVADVGRLHLSGFVAWMAWLCIHIFYLIGFRNRLLVLLQWAWAYVTFQRGARLITRSNR